MSKSLCKYRRAEISDKAAAIGALVSQPRFLCRSCARVSNTKGALCKPMGLPGVTVPSNLASPAVPEVGESLESGAVRLSSGWLSMSVKVRKLDKKLRKLSKKKRQYEKKIEKYQKKSGKYQKKAAKYQKKADKAHQRFDKLIYQASA
ncbi:hypothetical protein [Photobacterium sp. 1_MG-2023]|uniref:hypothetical protein n=1 Tax=Photobacterium sp. 1_MG-2023 TaxID=3062646 RepID=UPI0026E1B13E|nr:hypothetical protein [Photobacterium sp. 1_MG-2023]MDO6708273.1 hypothetical protein [Photobacterium sp. 1_MG-2023]